MNNDYRNTAYCPKITDLKSKKKVLSDKIIENHKVVDLYTYVRDNPEYREEFLKAYNYKCSYCGNSIVNIPNNYLEIDHYIYKTSFKNKADAGNIENLVLACFDCNRSKSSQRIPDDWVKKLNPDEDEIALIFIRDKEYYIKLSQEETNSFSKEFYYKLKLNYQTRRLDYLLLSMHGFINEIEPHPMSGELSKVLQKLRLKRNLTSLKIEKAKRTKQKINL